jgi:3-carboxy-cis,cis-muconate cycloisomerase
MNALLWPGDDRAGELFGDTAVLTAMVSVETAWLANLAVHGIAPRAAAQPLAGLTDADDVPGIARAAEAAGNPVVPLVALLRERAHRLDAETPRWLHRGLTSQDVLDSALMICARDTSAAITAELETQVRTLAELARAHRSTPMIARTLTQHAVPTTFGAKVAGWLHGLLDAADDLAATVFPAQFGGAAGTRAAVVELAVLAGADNPVATAAAVADATAADLGLRAAAPWHTARTPVTRVGDAWTRCTDAWGRVANDVLVLGRPEIGELAEATGDGRGGSSTMPNKANPVLSILIRRAALSAPGTAAQLHLAAAASVDERPDGAWHVEWQPLQLLARHALGAGRQASALCTGLQVHPERMRATFDAALPGALAERAGMRELFGAAPDDDPARYVGAACAVVDAALERARPFLDGER